MSQEEKLIERPQITKKEEILMVFWSYKLAQGLVNTQQHLIEYARGYYQSFSSTTLFQDTAFRMYAQQMKKGQHTEASATDIEAEKYKLQKHDKLLTGPSDEKMNMSHNVGMVAFYLLEEEHKYLVEEKGRPECDSREDGRRSYLIYYGRDRHTTGVQAFDTLMQEAWADLQTYKKQDQLNAIIAAHIPSRKVERKIRKKVEDLLNPKACPVHKK